MTRPEAPSNLPVPLAPEAAEEPGHVGGPAGRRAAATDPTFEAQVLGQPGIKRGLRGGEEVLKAARATYLGAEYSGRADRRPKPGILRKTEI